MYYLGVDWAVEKHDLCLLAADGRVLSEFSISNDGSGYQRLKEILEGIGDTIAVNIERPDGLLVDWFAAQGYLVCVVPPTILAHRRPRRSKDDRGDAYLLAHLLRTGDRDCRPLVRQSETMIHLRQLINAYDSTLRGLRQQTNRLVWNLRNYYPGVLKAFRCHHSPAFLNFLERFPTPHEARALNLLELRGALQEAHYPAINRLNHIYTALQDPTPRAFAEAGYAEVMLTILPLVRCYTEQRRALARRIGMLYSTHPDADWWHTFPGTGGPLTPARLLAALGDDRRRFPSAKVLQAVAGTAPVTRKSGKQIRVEFREACNKSLRRAADDLARQSVKHSGWAKAYYYDQLSRGHSKARAYRALGNRWLSIIWKLWQTGEPYDEVKRVANRSRQGQLLSA